MLTIYQVYLLAVIIMGGSDGRKILLVSFDINLIYSVLLRLSYLSEVLGQTGQGNQCRSRPEKADHGLQFTTHTAVL